MSMRWIIWQWVANYTEESFEIGPTNLSAANLAGDSLQVVGADQARREIRSGAARRASNAHAQAVIHNES